MDPAYEQNIFSSTILTIYSSYSPLLLDQNLYLYRGYYRGSGSVTPWNDVSSAVTESGSVVPCCGGNGLDLGTGTVTGPSILLTTDC